MASPFSDSSLCDVCPIASTQNAATSPWRGMWDGLPATSRALQCVVCHQQMTLRCRILVRRVERRFRERLSGGGRRRWRPTLGGGGNGAWSDGSDAAAAADWAALPDSAGFDGGILGGRGGARLGGAAGQPTADWEAAAVGPMLPAGSVAAAGGGEQGRSLEITPVEVHG